MAEDRSTHTTNSYIYSLWYEKERLRNNSTLILHSYIQNGVHFVGSLRNSFNAGNGEEYWLPLPLPLPLPPPRGVDFAHKWTTIQILKYGSTLHENCWLKSQSDLRRPCSVAALLPVNKDMCTSSQKDLTSVRAENTLCLYTQILIPIYCTTFLFAVSAPTCFGLESWPSSESYKLFILTYAAYLVTSGTLCRLHQCKLQC